MSVGCCSWQDERPYKTDTKELALSPHIHTKKRSSEHPARRWPPTSSKKRPQHEVYLSGTSVVDLPASRTVRNKFLLFKLPYLWYFLVETRAKTLEKKMWFFTLFGHLELIKLTAKHCGISSEFLSFSVSLARDWLQIFLFINHLQFALKFYHIWTFWKH